MAEIQGYDHVMAHIAILWKELLNVDNVSPEDNFFSLGGSSMLAVRMLVQLIEEYKKEIDYTKFFDSPDLTTLSKLFSE